MVSVWVNDRGDTIVHSSGFSWLAFVAVPLWAFHRGHVKSSLLLAILCFALHSAVFSMADRMDVEGASGLADTAWILSFSLASGLLAGRCHTWLLKKAGFVMCAVDSA